MWATGIILSAALFDDDLRRQSTAQEVFVDYFFETAVMLKCDVCQVLTQSLRPW